MARLTGWMVVDLSFTRHRAAKIFFLSTVNVMSRESNQEIEGGGGEKKRIRSVQKELEVAKEKSKVTKKKRKEMNTRTRLERKVGSLDLS